MHTALQVALAPQFAAGLDRTHLTVRPGPGMSKETVLTEFIEAERAIAEGRVHQPPKPNAGVPAHIARFIAAH